MPAECMQLAGTQTGGRSEDEQAREVLIRYLCQLPRDFLMNGCALVRTSMNGLTVLPPKLEGQEALRRSVVIADTSLRHRIMDAARNAYRGLGGTEAEWMPRAPQLPE